MSAETIRRAAALLRERAEALTDNARRYPEDTGGPDANWPPAFIEDAFRKHAPIDPPYPPGCEQAWEFAGNHFAPLTPDFALAVAGWLEIESRQPETEHEDGAYTTGGPSLMALRVARAYLGDRLDA